MHIDREGGTLTMAYDPVTNASIPSGPPRTPPSQLVQVLESSPLLYLSSPTSTDDGERIPETGLSSNSGQMSPIQIGSESSKRTGCKGYV